jgi:hypothetical protein
MGLPHPVCKVHIEVNRDDDVEEGTLVERRLRAAGSPITHHDEFLEFDASRHHFSATVEHAKEDGEALSTLTMQLYGIDREDIEDIPQGAMVRVDAGIMDDELFTGVETVFFGSLISILGSIRGGERQWDIQASMSPSHLEFSSPTRAFEGPVRAGAIARFLVQGSDVKLDIPDSFNHIEFPEGYTVEEPDLMAELRKLCQEVTAGLGHKHTVSFTPESPFHVAIVDHRNLMKSGELVDIDAFDIELFSDYVLSGSASLSQAEAVPGVEFPEEVGQLHQRFLEDPEGEVHFAEYSVEMIFDPRIKLDNVISLMENGQRIGTIAGITSVSHQMGNMDRMGTAWTTHFQGPLADPLRDEVIFKP